jgi:hypothetical protein
VLTAVVENFMSMFGYVMCGTQPQQLHLVKVCAAACNLRDCSDTRRRDVKVR